MSVRSSGGLRRSSAQDIFRKRPRSRKKLVKRCWRRRRPECGSSSRSQLGTKCSSLPGSGERPAAGLLVNLAILQGSRLGFAFLPSSALVAFENARKKYCILPAFVSFDLVPSARNPKPGVSCKFNVVTSSHRCPSRNLSPTLKATRPRFETSVVSLDEE